MKSLFKLFRKDEQDKDIVLEKFTTHIEKAGLAIEKIDEEGLIHIIHREWTIRVSLDNLRRDYARDQKESLFEDFVDTIVNYQLQTPSWEEARANVFLSLFPADFDFQSYPNRPVTDDFNRVYVHQTEEGLSWIAYDHLEAWHITEEELLTQADQNMNALLEKAVLEITLIEDRKLGYFETTHTSIKSALLLSTTLKEKVSKEFGWPVYAVLPVRDFCYIFSETDLPFFSERLGATVVEEYQQSGYPITTEVLKFDDEGIAAIGKYAAEKG